MTLSPSPPLSGPQILLYTLEEPHYILPTWISKALPALTAGMHRAAGEPGSGGTTAPGHGAMAPAGLRGGDQSPLGGMVT